MKIRFEALKGLKLANINNLDKRKIEYYFFSLFKFDLKYMYLSVRSFDIVVLFRLLGIVAKYTLQNLRFQLL